MDEADVEWDERKRLNNRAKHGLDFTDVVDFDFATATLHPDRRRDYGEERVISTGYLHGRLCVLCWTRRGNRLRVISLRKANDREYKAYLEKAGSASAADR
jgi:uncharacterized DUF497 family protein